MLKSDLVNKLAEETSLSRKESRETLDTFFETIIYGLQNQKEIELRGFGSFRIRKCRARTGHNPITKEKVHIPSKNVVYFKSGKDLKKEISKKK